MILTGKLEVLATSSDRNLGARTFDNMLIQHFASYIKTKYNLDVLSETKATLKLTKECQRVKNMLSANVKVPFNVEYIMKDTDVSGVIERSEFDALAQNEVCPRILAVLKKRKLMHGASAILSNVLMFACIDVHVFVLMFVCSCARSCMWICMYVVLVCMLCMMLK